MNLYECMFPRKLRNISNICVSVHPVLNEQKCISNPWKKIQVLGASNLCQHFQKLHQKILDAEQIHIRISE